MIDTSGTTALSATEDTLLFARDYSVPGIADFEVTVEWSQPSSSTVWMAVDVEQFAGPGDVFIHGMLAVAPDAVVDDAQGETLPIAGLTQSTDGTLLALSQGDWDVFGHAGLYALDVTTAGVFATRWSTPAVPLTAIEFRPDGTLIGAGAALYSVDALTGATVEVGTTGVAPIVDLDVAPNGRILGISYPADAPSQLLDLSPRADALPAPHAAAGRQVVGPGHSRSGFRFRPAADPSAQPPVRQKGGLLMPASCKRLDAGRGDGVYRSGRTRRLDRCRDQQPPQRGGPHRQVPKQSPAADQRDSPVHRRPRRGVLPGPVHPALRRFPESVLGPGPSPHATEIAYLAASPVLPRRRSFRHESRHAEPDRRRAGELPDGDHDRSRLDFPWRNRGRIILHRHDPLQLCLQHLGAGQQPG
jgi:hypothetical protein